MVPLPPVIKYEVTREDCLAGALKNVGLYGDEGIGSLLLDQENNTHYCLDGTGLGAVGVQHGYSIGVSAEDITVLRSYYNDRRKADLPWTGMTFEMWLSLDKVTCPIYTDSFCQIVLVSFGDNSHRRDHRCGQANQIEITYRPWLPGISFKMISESRYWESCWEYPFWNAPIEVTQFPMHVAITMNEGAFTLSTHEWPPIRVWKVGATTYDLFINGTFRDTYAHEDRNPAASAFKWDSDHHLTLLDRRRFGYTGTYWPFQGRFWGFAIYNYTINDTDIFNLYKQRVVESAPFVYNQAVNVPEDGEDGDHYDNPHYYRVPVPSDELYKINLGVYDQDLDPLTPNFPDNHSLPTVIISSLPHIGYLYNLTGGPILTTPYTVDIIDGLYTVRYRPLHNEASPDRWTPYTSFQYYAEDNGNASRSENTATVSIIVDKKNDPPVGFNDSDLAYTGTRENIFHFFGSDIDDGDYVTGARVAIFPARGQLFQVCA